MHVLKTFLAQLKEAKVGFKRSANLHIRYWSEDDALCFCPITLVAYKQTGHVIDNGDIIAAGKHIGLRMIYVNVIANAADGVITSRETSRRYWIIKQAMENLDGDE